MPDIGSSQKKAVDFVESISNGGPVDTSVQITLNFHPDRTYNGVHILESLSKHDSYKSQFETSTSNGGLSAFPGGDRWIWESRIFNTAYDNSPPSERPKYGALNYLHSPYGGSPRFGSAYLRLNAECLERCTFCYPDSCYHPTDFGTAKKMSLIELAQADNKDLLDSYIEAQIHGVIEMSKRSY